MSGISPNSHKGQVTVTGNQDYQKKLNQQLIQAVQSDDFFLAFFMIELMLYLVLSVRISFLADFVKYLFTFWRFLVVPSPLAYIRPKIIEIYHVLV